MKANDNNLLNKYVYKLSLKVIDITSNILPKFSLIPPEAIDISLLNEDLNKLSLEIVDIIYNSAKFYHNPNQNQ